MYSVHFFLGGGCYIKDFFVNFLRDIHTLAIHLKFYKYFLFTEIDILHIFMLYLDTFLKKLRTMSFCLELYGFSKDMYMYLL